jgi:hypothetical protein
MNKSQSDRIHELCSQIAAEHDHKKFLNLVEELNRILLAENRSGQNVPGKQESSSSGLPSDS